MPLPSNLVIILVASVCLFQYTQSLIYEEDQRIDMWKQIDEQIQSLKDKASPLLGDYGSDCHYLLSETLIYADAARKQLSHRLHGQLESNRTVSLLTNLTNTNVKLEGQSNLMLCDSIKYLVCLFNSCQCLDHPDQNMVYSMMEFPISNELNEEHNKSETSNFTCLAEFLRDCPTSPTMSICWPPYVCVTKEKGNLCEIQNLQKNRCSTNESNEETSFGTVEDYTNAGVRQRYLYGIPPGQTPSDLCTCGNEGGKFEMPITSLLSIIESGFYGHFIDPPIIPDKDKAARATKNLDVNHYVYLILLYLFV